MSKTDKAYWFKRRRYGYGWFPVRWQGWAMVIIALLLIIGAAFVFANQPYSNESLWAYLTIVAMTIIVLLIIAAAKGPKPKWRWGKKRGDNPKEDF